MKPTIGSGHHHVIAFIRVMKLKVYFLKRNTVKGVGNERVANSKTFDMCFAIVRVRMHVIFSDLVFETGSESIFKKRWMFWFSYNFVYKAWVRYGMIGVRTPVVSLLIVVSPILESSKLCDGLFWYHYANSFGIFSMPLKFKFSVKK